MYLRKIKQQKEIAASKVTFNANLKVRQKPNQPTQKNEQKAKVGVKNGQKDYPEDVMTESVYSVNEMVKDEDLLSLIANKLLMIIESNTRPDKTDHDVIIDSILILWGKCKDIFAKVQTGSDETFKWVS